MNYAEIKQCDIANGIGVRTSLFVSGCRHHCPGCFNAEAWDFAAGSPFTVQVEDMLLDSLKPPYVAGISVLGGEPLEPENQEALIHLLGRVRKELPDKDVWMWTGFTLEELLNGASRACTDHLDELLSLVDVLVDGPFVEAEKDITLRFRGSANQRILDLRETLAEGKPVIWSDGHVFSTHSW